MVVQVLDSPSAASSSSTLALYAEPLVKRDSSMTTMLSTPTSDPSSASASTSASTSSPRGSSKAKKAVKDRINSVLCYLAAAPTAGNVWSHSVDLASLDAERGYDLKRREAGKAQKLLGKENEQGGQVREQAATATATATSTAAAAAAAAGSLAAARSERDQKKKREMEEALTLLQGSIGRMAAESARR